MFDLFYELRIGPLFLQLMPSEAFLDGGIHVGSCVGIEHPNIQKGLLESPSPKTIYGDIQSVPIGGVGGTSRQLLSGQLLQLWLNPDVIADFAQYICGNVSDFIMTD